MSDAPVKEGDLIAGKYRVARVLGAGGMGVVVQAHHEALDQRVAIKFLLADYAEHAEAAERFAREARAAARIRGEHVCRIMDVGKMDDGAPYMVMEYLEGSDLADVIEARGALPIDEAIDYVLQASEAIAEAHAAGIVHRDLKPPNLFLSARPDGTAVVKVLDFGISKTLDTPGTKSDISLTKTSTMMGSPLYMAPEQMKSSRDVDGRTDIWALGCILHEMLTAKPPFDGETVPEVCANIASEEPDPIENYRPDVPPQLSAAIRRALEKKPENRFQNVSEFVNAIASYGTPMSMVAAERVGRVLAGGGADTSGGRPAFSSVLSGSGISTGPRTGMPSKAASQSQIDVAPTVASQEVPKQGSGGGKALLFGGAGLLVLVGVVIGVFAFSSGGEPAKAEQPPTATSSTAASTDEKPPETAEPAQEPTVEPATSATASADPVAADDADAEPADPPTAARPTSAGPRPASKPKPKPGGKDPEIFDITSFGDRK